MDVSHPSGVLRMYDRRLSRPVLSRVWHPEQFRWDTMGGAYDHFLLRGIPPERALGAHLGTELTVAGQAGGFWLVRRR